MAKDMSNFVVLASYNACDELIFGENKASQLEIINSEQNEDYFAGYYVYNVYEYDKVNRVTCDYALATFVTEEALLQWVNGE